MKKKIFSLFFVLLLLTQMLPLRQIGSVLSSKQLNEELPHSMDLNKSCFKKSSQFSEYLSAVPTAAISAYIDYTFFSHAFADRIPQYPASEILVPPPNC